MAGCCRPVELAGRITNFSRRDPGELVAHLEGPEVPRLSARCCGLGGDCGGGGGGDGDGGGGGGSDGDGDDDGEGGRVVLSHCRHHGV